MSDKPDHIARILGGGIVDQADADAPAVSLALIEYLERKFKAPAAADYLTNSPNEAALNYNVSCQAGRDEVINLLRTLNQAQANL